MWINGNGEQTRPEPVKQPNWHFNYGFIAGAVLWQMFSTFIRYLLTN
jgi:hypothetical protein